MDDFGLLGGIHTTALPSLSNNDKRELQLDASGRLIIAGRFLEDAAHSSGDSGIHILAVRKDVEGSLVDTDGDYASLQVDENGRLRVVTDADNGVESYNATDDLANGADGQVSVTTSFTDVASISVASGTTLFLYGYSWDADKNAEMRIITDDTVNTVVYKKRLNSSASPGTSEHFSEAGRIEIAGAANLEVKMQVKTRQAATANATGSLHARTFTP